MRRFITTIALFTATVTVCRGAPVITSVSGNWIRNSTITISGSGFGTRASYATTPNRLNRMFDDFSDNGLLNSPYGTWGTFHDGEGVFELSSDTYRRTLHTPSDGFYRRKSTKNSGDDSSGYISISGRNEPQYYASFWIRVSTGFNIWDGGGTHQHKMNRLFSSNNSVSIYPSISSKGLNLLDWNYAADNVSPAVLRQNARITLISPNLPIGWHHVQTYYVKNSSPNAEDGKLEFWWDGQKIFSWASDIAPNSGWCCDADFDDSDLAGLHAFGDFFSSGQSSSTWVDYDDILVDYSRAQVFASTATSFSATTSPENQSLISWSDTQIQFLANTGAITQNPWIVITTSAGVASNSFRMGATNATLSLPGGTMTGIKWGAP